MAKTVLIPLPRKDFDPTEVAVPFQILRSGGVSVVFSTPDGLPATADMRMVRGHGLGPLKPLLRADKRGRTAHGLLVSAEEFNTPRPWSSLTEKDFDAILLPGGHAPGMVEYLESPVLQSLVSAFFKANKTVAAICHGTVLAVRSRAENNKSCLYGRKTTALLKSQELLAWALTALWLGNYYRTYSETVEDEVRRHLAKSQDFISGPLPLTRDSLENLSAGFVVRDGNYLSARWPGDAHRFGVELLNILRDG